jgi:hypothetical protein
VALLEKRRYLNNRSGDFPQVILIVPSHVPNKDIVQPFELGGKTRLIRSAVKYWKAGKFLKKILMIQSHERSVQPFSAA